MTKVIALTLALAAAGCLYGTDIETDVDPLITHTFSATEGSIDLYQLPSDIIRPYVEIARIKVVGTFSDRPTGLEARLHEKARALGAHAVLEAHRGYESRDRGELITEILGESDRESYDAAILVAWAIRYVDTEEIDP